MKTSQSAFRKSRHSKDVEKIVRKVMRRLEKKYYYIADCQSIEETINFQEVEHDENFYPEFAIREALRWVLE